MTRGSLGRMATVSAVLSVPLACVALAGQVDWTASRADGVAPRSGVQWEWPELGRKSCSRWGWQSSDKAGEDGHRAGSWTTFPPRDFAVQVLGKELVERCQAQFADGATSCSVSADGVELVLGSDGSVTWHIAPEALAERVRAGGKFGATRAVNGNLEWYVDDEGKHQVGAPLPK